MADPTPLLEEGKGEDTGAAKEGEEEEEAQLGWVEAKKQQLMDLVKVGKNMASLYDLPLATVAFIAGYYADVFMEIYSAWQMFQTPQTQILGYALVFILFVSPVVCWLLLLSNDLESVMGGPLYVMHIMPIIEGLRLRTSWAVWKISWDQAVRVMGVPPLPLRKTPVLTWLPVCKAIFSSSLTLLFKVYGTLIQTRNYMSGLNRTTPRLEGVIISVAISVLSMSYSVVKLSYYGMRPGLVTLMKTTSWRFLEIFSRVSSIGLLGIVYVETHCIIALLTTDFVLQFLILVLHPSPRRLLKNGMSFMVMVFWALLMVLCAPPNFIPQLKDVHGVYFVLRTLELAFILGAITFRCGQPWTPKIVGNAELDATCALAHIDTGSGAPFWMWLLAVSCYISALGVAGLAFGKVWQTVQRRLQKRRVQLYRKEQAQAVEVESVVGDGLAPIMYDQVLYLRVNSVANRFLLSEPEAKAEFQMVRMPTCTDEDMKDASFVSRATWRFVPTSEEAYKLGKVRYGDVLKIRSDVHMDRFLSGGRRGNNTFVGTHLHMRDLQEFVLDYDLDEHYSWKVVALSPQVGPDPALRVGETLDYTDHFALMVMPGRSKLQQLYLSGCRGPTTEPVRSEVWTVPFHSRAAFEDSPLDASWPSFEFFAQRRPVLDHGDITDLVRLQQKEREERGAALATAGQNEDIMMQTFMMQSGVPMSVTDDQYFTPLHHFVFQYAREGDPQVLEAQKDGNTDQAFEVEHRVPIKVFHAMLHSGLPRLELGGKAMYTPLHFASLLGERQLCDALLEAGADLNVGDGDGWTCLHDAVLYGHKATLKYLLNQRDLDPNVSSRSGVRPVDLTDDEEILGWLVARGARLRGTNEVEPLEVPPAPEGSKFFTHFVDPRENVDLGLQTCALDNQALVGKFLAAPSVPTLGGQPACFYCVRYAWSGNIALCPLFRCPFCDDKNRIPYFDSEWDVCWVCHTCCEREGKDMFPHWQRIETGKRQYGSGKAEQFFKELDTDGSGTLSKSEFVVFFKKLDGILLEEDSKQTKLPAKSFDYCEKIFEKIDTNGDGSISFKEFKVFFGVHDLEAEMVVRVIEDFDPLEDGVNEVVTTKRTCGMKATVLHPTFCIDTETLSKEDACILEFEDGLCIMDPLDAHKIKADTEEGEEDDPSSKANVESRKRSSIIAAQTAHLRKGQRTTFSCVPCVESCLLLA